VLESFASLDVALLNNGWNHTFSRAGVGSIIDLTFISCSLWSHSRWAVSEAYTASDHNAILLELHRRPAPPVSTVPVEKAYRVDTLNPEMFAETFLVPGQGTNAEQTAVLLMQAITVACNASMLQRRGFKRHHQPVYW